RPSPLFAGGCRAAGTRDRVPRLCRRLGPPARRASSGRARHAAAQPRRACGLVRCREPKGEGVRVDSGVAEGQTITVHYDPMIAKLIAHADSRAGALDRAVDALRRFDILGVRKNIAFLIALLTRPEVAQSHTHTRFIEAHLDDLAQGPPERLVLAAAAMAARVSADGITAPREGAAGLVAGHTARNAFDPWQLLGPVVW